jgi:ABC-type glycerol-3-phosphate transport system permease component
MSLVVVHRPSPARKIGGVLGIVVLNHSGHARTRPPVVDPHHLTSDAGRSVHQSAAMAAPASGLLQLSAVFDQIPIARFFFNSVVVTGLIVVGQTVTCTLSGYAFAMIRFPGRGLIFGLFLATMMVPLQTIIIPVFVIVRVLGLSNSYCPW